MLDIIKNKMSVRNRFFAVKLFKRVQLFTKACNIRDIHITGKSKISAF